MTSAGGGEQAAMHSSVFASLRPREYVGMPTEKSDAAAWQDLKRLASELDPYWPKNIDAVEVVRDIRRDL